VTGDTVLVVGEGGKLAPRPVKLGPSQGDEWVVLDGLKAGEQVMVDGFQKLPRVKPGDPVIVQPVPWSAPGTAPAKAPEASDKSAAPATKS